VFRAAPGARPVIANLDIQGGQHIALNGLDLRGDLGMYALNRSSPSSPEVTDVVVQGGRIQSFHITGAQHVLIENNDIGHYSLDTMPGVNSLYSDNGQPTERDVRVIGNVFRDITITNPSHNECLFVKRINGLVISGNKFIGCPGLAIAFYDAQNDPATGNAYASNVLVENNFLQCRPLASCYGGSMALEASTKGDQIFRNFIFRFNSTDGSIAMLDCSAALCQNVKAYGNAGSIGNGWPARFANVPRPRYVNSQAGDFHAVAGAPQIGAVPASVCKANGCPATDIDGHARPRTWALDAGANQREPASIVLSRGIGAARIGMQESDVVAFYGRPQQVRRRAAFAGGPSVRVASYRRYGGRLWITYSGQQVVGVRTTSTYYETGAGLGPGTDLSRATSAGFRHRCRNTYRRSVGGVVASVSATKNKTVSSVSLLARGYAARRCAK